MGVLLMFMSFAAFGLGCLIIVTGTGAIQEAIGVLVLLIAAVFFVGAAVVNAIAKLESVK